MERDDRTLATVLMGDDLDERCLLERGGLGEGRGKGRLVRDCLRVQTERKWRLGSAPPDEEKRGNRKPGLKILRITAPVLL